MDADKTCSGQLTFLGLINKGVRRTAGLLLECTGMVSDPWANRDSKRITKASETFRARKAIVSQLLSKNRKVCTPETSCVKGTSGNIKICEEKSSVNHKV